MIIKLSKTYLFFALFVILGGLYAVNIFSINKVSELLVDKPVKLSFVLVVPDKDECEKCFDAQKIVNLIDSSHNIKILGKKTLTLGNLAYSKTIGEYEIKNLPALVISGDIADKRIVGSWNSLGGKKVNGKIVIQNLLPFYDIAEKNTKGLISAILLKDDTCTECFNEEEYINMIQRRGMTIGNSTVYDISSDKGALLVEQYEITKIPALILSSDAGDYLGFAESWKEVGTEEEDGSFVLRNVQKIANGLTFKEI